MGLLGKLWKWMCQIYHVVVIVKLYFCVENVYFWKWVIKNNLIGNCKAQVRQKRRKTKTQRGQGGAWASCPLIYYWGRPSFISNDTMNGLRRTYKILSKTWRCNLSIIGASIFIYNFEKQSVSNMCCIYWHEWIVIFPVKRDSFHANTYSVKGRIHGASICESKWLSGFCGTKVVVTMTQAILVLLLCVYLFKKNQLSVCSALGF